MARVKRLFRGGSVGNAQLTAVVATILLVLLAIEGATLLQLRSLLTVHSFVGILLIPVVGLKLASTGWRTLRYYTHAEEYVEAGPPQVALRVLIAPLIVLSTIVLFGTGVILLARDQTLGLMVGLHKASFIVWVGATSVHVLAHALKLPGALRARIPGLAVRLAVAGATVICGIGIAVATLPAADKLQDHASTQLGFDRH